MRKTLSFLLALVMIFSLMSVVSFAAEMAEEKTPSPEAEITVEAEGATITVVESELAEEELMAATEAASASEYFGTEVEGKVVELFAVEVSNVDESRSEITITLTIPTELEDGAKCTVLFGIPAAESVVNWTPFNGNVSNGTIKVTVPVSYAKQLQEAGTVLIAVCA